MAHSLVYVTLPVIAPPIVAKLALQRKDVVGKDGVTLVAFVQRLKLVLEELIEELPHRAGQVPIHLGRAIDLLVVLALGTPAKPASLILMRSLSTLFSTTSAQSAKSAQAL